MRLIRLHILVESNLHFRSHGNDCVGQRLSDLKSICQKYYMDRITIHRIRSHMTKKLEPTISIPPVPSHPNHTNFPPQKKTNNNDLLNPLPLPLCIPKTRHLQLSPTDTFLALTPKPRTISQTVDINITQTIHARPFLDEENGRVPQILDSLSVVWVLAKGKTKGDEVR